MPEATVPDNAPEHCPGTESEEAGKADACAGCPNAQICATAPKGPDPDLPVIQKRLELVKRKVLVLSGKGGVGKSTFTTQLAHAFAADPIKQVGVVDVDVCGPSIPRMLSVTEERLHASASGWQPVYASDNLACVSVGLMLEEEGDAVIWRGPKKNGIIKQFLRDVDWGDEGLDILLVDTPPGTSDEHLAVVSSLKLAGIDGAILVTTPQEVSIQDVRRELDFCRKVGIKVLGLVENMSGFSCPNCHKASDIFPPTTGGAKALASEYSVPFLGSVPLDPRLAHCCDRGQSFVEEWPGTPAALGLGKVSQALMSSLAQLAVSETASSE